MPKLVYIVDWLPPDYGAIGQYALAESRERALAGDEVVLIGLTSGRERVEREALGAGSLTVIRISSPPVDRLNFRRRAAWTLRTDARLVAQALRHLRGADELLFTASPPFLEHLIVPLSPLFPTRVVFRIADLHPECLINELERTPAWLKGFLALARFQRRRADVVEVLGEDQKRLLVGQGVDARRIVLRRSVSPVTITGETRPVEVPQPLRDKAVLLYSGAVGHAHDFETFVEGFHRHHRMGSGRVGFWLNAGGARADEFEDALRRRGLPVHRSQPVPIDQLASLLVTPSAHLITLREEYTGLVVPSKVYGCLASGRDILFVGSEGCDVHLLCAPKGPGAYQRVAPRDVSGMAAALELVADRAEMNAASAGATKSE